MFYTDIQQGKFTRDFVLENQSGGAYLTATRRLEEEHPIEEVGKRLRDMMPWLKKGKGLVSDEEKAAA